VLGQEKIAQLRLISRQARAIETALASIKHNSGIYERDASFMQTNSLIQAARSILADTAFSNLLPAYLTVDAGPSYVAATSVLSTLAALRVCVDEVIESEASSEVALRQEVESLRTKLSEAEVRSLSLKDDELRERCLDLLLRPGKADTAVREAAVVLEDRIRKVSELGASDIGVVLVDKALNPRAGVLTFEGPDSERRAMHELFRGAIGAFKNPTSHKIVPDYDVTRARQVVGLVDVLLQLLQETRRRDPMEVAEADSAVT
jgi:uncharacterized protein (TIGR02391 family)